MPIQKDKAGHATAYKNIVYITDEKKTFDKNGKRWVETFNMSATGDSKVSELHEEFELINKYFNKNRRYNERKYYHIVLNFKNTKFLKSKPEEEKNGTENNEEKKKKIDSEGSETIEIEIDFDKLKDLEYDETKEITPEMAMTIGREYIQKFYPEHQAVMALHFDTEGIHFHSCVNSVNMRTGKKVNQSNYEMKLRKDFANQISYELYGIEPLDWKSAHEKRVAENNEKIENREKIKFSSAEIDIHRDREEIEAQAYSWKERVRAAVAQAAMHTTNRQEFAEYLEAVHGITMSRNTANTVTFEIEHNGKTKKVRGGTLGGFYTSESIDYWLEYNRKKESSAALAKKDPVIPVFDVAVKHDENIATENYIQLYKPNGQPKSLIELVFTLGIMTICQNYPENRNNQIMNKTEQVMIRNGQVSFIDKNGEVIRFKTDEKIQNLYDSMVFCKDEGFNNLSDAHRKYDNLQKELSTYKRQERSLNSSIKKMKPIAELIETKKNLEKGIGEGIYALPELKKTVAALHNANIHNDRDIEDFERRYNEITERLNKADKNIKQIYRDKSAIEKAIYHIDCAQNTMYCYDRSFTVDNREEAERLVYEAEKEDIRNQYIARDEEGVVSNVDALIGGAKSIAQYEERLRNRDAYRKNNYYEHEEEELE